jgi:hypothetical protein
VHRMVWGIRPSPPSNSISVNPHKVCHTNKKSRPTNLDRD